MAWLVLGGSIYLNMAEDPETGRLITFLSKRFPGVVVWELKAVFIRPLWTVSPLWTPSATT